MPLKRNFKRRIPGAKHVKNLLANHYHNLGAATPKRFLVPSGTRQWNSARRQRQAALMQPLQSNLHRKVPTPHVSAHMATQHGNKYTAVPLRSETKDFTSAKKVRTREHTQSTLKPLLLQRGKRSQRGCRLHYTKNHNVSCSGRLPNRSPMQHPCKHDAAICIVAKANASTHMATQHDSNHAVIQPTRHRFHKRIELRTQGHTQSTLKPLSQCGNENIEVAQTSTALQRSCPSSPRQPLYAKKRQETMFCSPIAPQHQPHTPHDARLRYIRLTRPHQNRPHYIRLHYARPNYTRLGYIN